MKTAIITGASSGIGKDIARLAAECGYRVGVLDVNREQAEAVAAEIDEAVPLVADVCNTEQVEAALETFGDTPDLVVNNAGIVRFGSLLEQTVDDFRKVLDINFTGTFIVAQAAAKRMVAKSKGVIINLASINAICPGTNIGSYPASKAAVVRLTEQMAIEWGPLGLRVNTISPGFIDGGMSKDIYADSKVRQLRGGAVPLQRLGQTRDIAEAVLFLASDAAKYITGQNLAVDGGVVQSVIAQLPRV